MFCSKCGAAVAADSLFCTACGSPQAPAPLALPPAVVVNPNIGVAGYTGISGQHLYAGFWLRFLAYLVDSVIMGTASLALLVPLIALTGVVAHIESLQDISRHGQVDPAVIFAILSVVLTFAAIALVVGWLYHAYFESSSWQGTPGKHVTNIYVTDLAGQPITFLNATGRFFAKWVTGLIPLFLGYIMAAFTERRQALHDMIASTLVLRR